ncbi:MAG: DNA polymerase [Actinomycetota bacterium]|nr:DNA polymerase [Actinomycetota bacterium]
MAIPVDPRPQPSKTVADVPITFVDDSSLEDFTSALRQSVMRAVDTETVYDPGAFRGPNSSPGSLRVISAATRDEDGSENAWVLDVRQLDSSAVAAALNGITADAWNADFDARVIDRDLFAPTRESDASLGSMMWWDAQLADALLHQGRTGFGFYHGLAWAVEWYLGLRVEGKGSTQLSYTKDNPLSVEQVTYAAADAVETLWVAEEIRSRIAKSGLTEVCRLEQHARPFLDHMERVGLPFDWVAWEQRLAGMDQQRIHVSGRLAELTGGGQGTLFDGALEPSWNPGSERQAKEALNEWGTEEVLAWSSNAFGEKRLLLPTDPLTATVLSEIGGDICQALLEYRDLTKVLSTYGDSIREHIDSEGRMHSEYLQVVGTNTGRLASRRPNAQNFSPKMKQHIRPADSDRVFVYSDLSQAELRFATQVAGDTNLRDAFRAGTDIHSATAERMFNVDMQALAASEPGKHTEFRDKAKRINFGIVYGQRGAGLARSLSQAGVETSTDEGQRLLEQYLAAYPQIAAWVNRRDRFVEGLASSPHNIDWQLTLRLHTIWPQIRQAVRQHRDEYRNWPSAEEVFTRLGSPWTIDEIAWTLSFEAPVVLTEDLEAFGFQSFTESGRRQQFTFHTEGVLGQAAKTIVSSLKEGPERVRRTVSESHNVNFESAGRLMSSAEITKLLEDRPLRRVIVDEVETSMGLEAMLLLLNKSLASRVSQMANAYRNAPIQGGVADVMLEAYGLLHERLSQFDRAVGVQTVHDSVVVECDRVDAVRVAHMVKDTMEEAMQIWCPDVAAKADTDIRASLSDRDVIESI